MHKILANKVVGISELKTNPAAILTAAAEEPVAILNRNKPAGYIISPEVWEAIADRLEDIELTAIANKRLNDGNKPVKVSLDEL
ncbi:type II toxin-antitoxin system prevent-host-death family antitoxin [Paludibacterium purpuratum]|uniref:Antitoxin n=1 Tax=Paludibacterium purpuratum TaxID=1144873 RepID=A0A4R7B5L6_9NEIS|nr:type II toxin-antitoxin system prevent-host-death family antitoxin [Paludibacterium purpuratum]TDR79964.1 antitoxin StbD [Paludibacterium purpuratum]